jgi:hypothetical protein
MVSLTSEQSLAWCAERGVRIDATSGAHTVSFVGSSAYRFRFQPPADPPGRVALANAIAVPHVLSSAEEAFGGGLFWLQDWDIWSDTIERVGLELLQLSLVVEPDCRGLHEAPARFYAADELVKAQTAISLVLLFEWNAYVIPSAHSPVFNISHHGYVDVISNELLEHESLSARFLKVWKQLPIVE